MQRRPGRCLQQQLRPITSGPAFHRSRHRPEQFDTGQALFGQQALSFAARFIKKTFSLPWFVCFGRNNARCANGGKPAARRSLKACSANAK